MTSSTTNVSGMAASIRGSVESETFDLGGQTVTTISHMVHDAFSEPFTLLDNHNKMIRITLVTGAGKLARQKYDENAAKAVTTALREAGFQEDRAASCVVECAGTFKLQHDTGKNLKTVVVFPKVVVDATTNANQQNGGTEDANANAFSSMSLQSNNNNNRNNGNNKTAPLIPGLTSEQWTALISPSSNNKALFEKMMDSKCPSWKQKRQCLTYVEQIKQLFDELDQSLCKGTVLTDPQQAFYDTVSVPALEEKLSILKDQMHHLVEGAAHITLEEKRMLQSQVAERIEFLAKEIANTPKSNKVKMEKLQALHAKALERKALLDKIQSQPPHGLRQETEIRKLRKELQPLLELEAATKGRLLTIKETQTLARKDEILQEITQLENASRGWFEDDALFAARLQASRTAWNNLVKQAAKKKPANSSAPSSSSNRTAANSWATKPIARTAAKPATAAAKNKTAKTGGSVFAAMMMDSDSD